MTSMVNEGHKGHFYVHFNCFSQSVGSVRIWKVDEFGTSLITTINGDQEKYLLIY